MIPAAAVLTACCVKMAIVPLVRALYPALVNPVLRLAVVPVVMPVITEPAVVRLIYHQRMEPLVIPVADVVADYCVKTDVVLPVHQLYRLWVNLVQPIADVVEDTIVPTELVLARPVKPISMVYAVITVKFIPVVGFKPVVHPVP